MDLQSVDTVYIGQTVLTPRLEGPPHPALVTRIRLNPVTAKIYIALEWSEEGRIKGKKLALDELLAKNAILGGDGHGSPGGTPEWHLTLRDVVDTRSDEEQEQYERGLLLLGPNLVPRELAHKYVTEKRHGRVQPSVMREIRQALGYNQTAPSTARSVNRGLHEPRRRSSQKTASQQTLHLTQSDVNKHYPQLIPDIHTPQPASRGILRRNSLPNSRRVMFDQRSIQLKMGKQDMEDVLETRERRTVRTLSLSASTVISNAQQIINNGDVLQERQLLPKLVSSVATSTWYDKNIIKASKSDDVIRKTSKWQRQKACKENDKNRPIRLTDAAKRFKSSPLIQSIVNTGLTNERQSGQQITEGSKRPQGSMNLPVTSITFPLKHHELEHAKSGTVDVSGYHKLISEYRRMAAERITDNKDRGVPFGDALLDHMQAAVCVRKRPMFEKERIQGEIDAISTDKDKNIIVHRVRRRIDGSQCLENTNYEYDCVFDDHTITEEVYEYACKPLVKSIFDIRKATCFAFGQTGSGKTYTMLGPTDNHGHISEYESGICFMAGRDLLQLINTEEHSHLHLRLEMSFFEIYNNKSYDLLNNRKTFRVALTKDQIVISGLRQVTVETMSDISSHLEQGVQCRAMGVTSLNEHSSRSHAVLQYVLCRDVETPRQKLVITHGKISIVDLAGNEQAHVVAGDDAGMGHGRSSSKMGGTSQGRVESSEINRSLLALKECVRALVKKKGNIEPPYRDSMLTKILRDSLNGYDATLVSVIATINPLLSCMAESHETLRYATNCRGLSVTMELVSTDAGARAGGLMETQPLPGHSYELRPVTKARLQALQLARDKLYADVDKKKLLDMHEHLLDKFDAWMVECDTLLSSALGDATEVDESDGSFRSGSAVAAEEELLNTEQYVRLLKENLRNLVVQNADVIKLLDVASAYLNRLKKEKTEEKYEAHDRSETAQDGAYTAARRKRSRNY